MKISLQQMRFLSQFVILILSLLTGCSEAIAKKSLTATVSGTPRWLGTLQPYLTPTTKVTPSPLAVQKAIEVSPTPTATPFTHVVVKGETMLGIAIRYGVTLEELKSANPEVDPRLMSVGQVLVIPILNEIIEVKEVLLTPVPLTLSEPRCYPLGNGGLSCVVEVVNETDIPADSVQVRFGLYNREGDLENSQVANTPLNLLSTGERSAVLAAFPPPISEGVIVRVELATAIQVASPDGRYIDTTIKDEKVAISPSKLSARVDGVATVEEPIAWLWMAATAYDDRGNIVGIRKWKGQPSCGLDQTDAGAGFTPTSQTETPPSPVCGPFIFEFSVYSLGPEISRVVLSSEAGR